MGDQSPSTMPVTIVVEHLDPELGAWSALEYGCIARESHASGSKFLLSSVPTSLQMPEDLAATKGLEVEHRGVEEVFADRKSKVCLLDPSAKVELSPTDGDTFEAFLFGGILDRTSELRKKGYEGRRLGPVQMTTDTAVRVTRMVVHDKVPLEEISYIDHPEIVINEHERTEMPFRYVNNGDGKPIMPKPFRRTSGSLSSFYLSTWAVSIIFLLNPITTLAQSAADYYVKSLPGAPEGALLKMHAGHIEVNKEHNGHLFFWHYQNRHIANRQRTVIWLNGGPGCSSMDGALMEVGPYRLKDNETLEYNEGSWDEFANLLFVDQPVGTGFSFANTNSYLHELDEMASQFVKFLEKWFAVFPEYERDDIYFAGESYAGQYIPYIAKAIQDRNKNINRNKDARWNVRGLLIGNGWISPAEQYPAYLSYAYEEGLVQEGSKVGKELEVLLSVCKSKMETGHTRVSIMDCEEVLNKLLAKTLDSDHQCLNMYDIRLRDGDSCGMAWPPDLADVKPYLQSREVVQALNINPDKRSGWDECDGGVSSSFRPQKSEPSVNLLPGLLESGIEVLLFSGDKDLICNHVGTEELISNMKWAGATGFETSPGVWAPRHDWTFEDEPAGYYQHARNLTYVLFYNASHMVPFDLPRRSRDMVDRFMNVDIASIGGAPADSRIDGESLPQTSVGGHPNSTVAEEEEQQKIKETEWNAYAKSGEAVLVVVIIGVLVWGFFIWRSRRRHSGYRGISIKSPSSTSVLRRFHNKRSTGADVEAGDFDEAELDDLHSPGFDRENYAVGDDDSDDEGHPQGQGQHQAQGYSSRAGINLVE
ncbi:alpha/beta-hydrolase [Aspergillus aurantiobrunneus]